MKLPIKYDPNIYSSLELGIGNLGVAAMKAGYAGSNIIEFDIDESKYSFFENNKNRIEEFMDFLLNEDGCSDMEFSTELKWTVKKTRGDKDVNVLSSHCLALSGGLDSLASYLTLLDDNIKSVSCMFLNYHQEQLKFEEKSFVDVVNKYNISTAIPIIVNFSDREMNNDKGWHFGDFKIPASNFTILSLLNRFLNTESDFCSLNYGVYSGEIMDKNRDKSQKFFTECSDIFSEYNESPTMVRSPVSDMTKVEMMNYLSQRGDLEFALNTSRTCISTNDDPCMNCKPCFNRSLSVVLSGFEKMIPMHLLDKLSKSDTVKSYAKDLSKYQGERKKQIFRFLGFLKVFNSLLEFEDVSIE